MNITRIGTNYTPFKQTKAQTQSFGIRYDKSSLQKIIDKIDEYGSKWEASKSTGDHKSAVYWRNKMIFWEGIKDKIICDGWAEVRRVGKADK